MDRKKILFALIPILLITVALGYRFQAGVSPFSSEITDLGPGHHPASWPKAFCTEPLETVNVILWTEDELSSEQRSKNYSGSDLRGHANKILMQFWDGPVSIIETSDVSTALPQNEKQLSLFVEEFEDDKVVSFAILFGTKERQLTLRPTYPDAPKLGVGRLFLKYSNDGDEKDKLAFYIQSLTDLATGKCSRPVSEFIVGPESQWKFFPPYDEYYENWKKQ